MSADIRPDGPLSDLMDAARAGDVEAFGELYAQHRAAVFGAILRRVGHRETAEDLTADTFLRAFAHLDSFAWRGRDPGAWLQTIARNAALDYLKSHTHRTAAAYDPDVLARLVDDGPDGCPEQVAVARMLSGRLVRLMAELGADQRRAVWLRYVAGLPLSEVAQLMGRSEKAASSLASRGVQVLRAVLAAPAEVRHDRYGEPLQVVRCESCHGQLDGLNDLCPRIECRILTLAAEGRGLALAEVAA